MRVTFISHACIYIEERDTSIILDPWFYGSDYEHPVIDSISGKHKTIDFQVPPTREKIEDYNPDAILISHTHTHHSPARDIKELIAQKGEVIFGYPVIDAPGITAALSDLTQVHHVAATDQTHFKLGSLEITAYTHTVGGHLAWHIKGETGSVLHVADARAHKNEHSQDLDPLWEKFYNLKPDHLFMSASANRIRQKTPDGTYEILNSMIFSPGEVANLVPKIKPNTFSLIGCYNKSLFSTRIEYLHPSYIIEDELYWALSWTTPETRLITLRPSTLIGIREKEGSFDYSIE